MDLIKRLTRTPEQIARDLNLQVIAKFNPGRLNINEGWVPKTPFDKHCWRLYNENMDKTSGRATGR